MSPAKKWFAGAVLFAFPGVALLFNTNSYHADKHGIGWLYIVVGVALCLGCIYCFKKVNDYAGTKGSDRGR